MRPASSSWLHFTVCLAAFAIIWDAHFFFCHYFAHQWPWAYKFFHKMHHNNKEPNCFGAYFVNYGSHILLEQSVVFYCAVWFLPRDVFVFYLYLGTLGTYIEHGGHDMSKLKLPLLPINWGQISGLLNFYGAPLGFVTTQMHDWHHEKFTGNYALTFTWLDKLFGTYVEGRMPGAGVEKVRSG